MKILQISLAFPKSGVGGIDADLANALAKNGHDVTVVVLDSDATDEERLPRKVGLISMLRVKTGRVFTSIALSSRQSEACLSAKLNGRSAIFPTNRKTPIKSCLKTL